MAIRFLQEEIAFVYDLREMNVECNKMHEKSSNASIPDHKKTKKIKKIGWIELQNELELIFINFLNILIDVKCFMLRIRFLSFAIRL